MLKFITSCSKMNMFQMKLMNSAYINDWAGNDFLVRLGLGEPLAGAWRRLKPWGQRAQWDQVRIAGWTLLIGHRNILIPLVHDIHIPKSWLQKFPKTLNVATEGSCYAHSRKSHEDLRKWIAHQRKGGSFKCCEFSCPCPVVIPIFMPFGRLSFWINVSLVSWNMWVFSRLFLDISQNHHCSWIRLYC